MRILFLSRWFPFPPNNGSKLCIFNLIRGLAEEHELTMISFVEPGVDSMGIEGMFPYCKAVKTIQRRPFDPDSMRSLMGYISPTPRSVVDTYMAEMEASIKQALSETRYDIIIASQFDMAIYIHSFGAVPALFEEAEVSVYYDDYARAASSWERFRYGLTWLKYRRYMRGLMRNFQACTVASHQEAELVAMTLSLLSLSLGCWLAAVVQALEESKASPVPGSLAARPRRIARRITPFREAGLPRTVSSIAACVTFVTPDTGVTR